jgi:hypothetical protein
MSQDLSQSARVIKRMSRDVRIRTWRRRVNEHLFSIHNRARRGQETAAVLIWGGVRHVVGLNAELGLNHLSSISVDLFTD